MKTDFLVIGGGIAGLSAANTLAERGANVTLLEGGSYPSHKICGEFLSPEAIPLIEKWGIEPAAYVTRLKAVLPNRELFLKLPEKAAAIPRYFFDEELAKRAEKNGAQIMTSSSVEKIEVPTSSGKPYVVTLASGEQWTSPVILVSTGRLLNTLDGLAPPKFCYIGAKAHFEGIDCQDELVMHLMPGAYFGMVSIGQNRVNVAGLMTCTTSEAKNPKAAFSAFFARPEAKSLKEALGKGHNLFEDWIVGPVPEFGVRNQPKWPNAYFLGDAAGIIPPATGNGLAMGLTSGILAADYALKGLPEAYRDRWAKEYSGRIGRGKLLHKLFLSPRIADPLLCVGSLFPSLVNLCFRATRGGI